MHFPFKRFLVCSDCGAKTDINFCDFTIKISKLDFILTCAHCDSKGKAEVEDKRVLDPSGINIVRWDPRTPRESSSKRSSDPPS